MKERPMMRRRRSAGQTLLELIGAITIIAITLVPSLQLIGDTMRIGRQTETANLLATYSASKLEEHLVRTAGVWDTIQDADFIPGYDPALLLRYQVDKVAETAGLMRITSRAWVDTIENATWDAGEMQVSYASKLARNVSYQQEASGI